MTTTALHDALSRITRVAADNLRAWADTPGLIGPAGFGLNIPSASGVCQAARLTTAVFVLPLWLVIWLALGAGATHAASPFSSRPPEVWPVETAFREAVQLWANERFEALWESGLRASRYRVSREAFVRGMRHRVVKPTCCWDQIHAVRVHCQATDEALVEAQIGVNVKTLGTTVVRSMIVYLRQEEGVWRITLEDFLTKPEDAQSGLRAVVTGRGGDPIIAPPCMGPRAAMGGQGPRVTSALTASTAAGVGVSSDRPDTCRVSDGMEHGQGHHQQSQPDIGRGVRQR